MIGERDVGQRRPPGSGDVAGFVAGLVADVKQDEVGIANVLFNQSALMTSDCRRGDAARIALDIRTARKNVQRMRMRNCMDGLLRASASASSLAASFALQRVGLWERPTGGWRNRHAIELI
jgi:hypothetical protein